MRSSLFLISQLLPHGSTIKWRASEKVETQMFEKTILACVSEEISAMSQTALFYQGTESLQSNKSHYSAKLLSTSFYSYILTLCQHSTHFYFILGKNIDAQKWNTIENSILSPKQVSKRSQHSRDLYTLQSPPHADNSSFRQSSKTLLTQNCNVHLPKTTIQITWFICVYFFFS